MLVRQLTPDSSEPHPDLGEPTTKFTARPGTLELRCYKTSFIDGFQIFSVGRLPYVPVRMPHWRQYE